MTNSADPLTILQQYWSFDSFRPLQLDIINSVLNGQDTLALLPTGGGKSICFQVPALAKDGICLVVSPLISLMKDQVYNLNKRNIEASAIYSGMPYRDLDRILDNAVYGKTKFLYLSPERLASELALERIKKMNVNLIAIDEAHCISQWGYDFRPAYLQINEIREWHPKVPVLALTATATTEVIDDIQEKLEFKSKNLIQGSFERKNLVYAVLKEENKFSKLLEILQNVKGTSIVYARSRKKTKEIALQLRKAKISADVYHAGLSTKQRSEIQQNWIDNKIRVVVATNAFGMGIDKPDVRTVVHLDLPDSLEAYYQEAGRAGRDQQKAYTVLLYSNEDKIRLEKNLELSYPELKKVRTVYRALASYFQLAIGSGKGKSFDFVLVEFCKNYDLGILETFNILKLLDREAYISLSDAIFIPSTLYVKMGKVELYDFLIKNQKFENLLKTILRVYQGAFKSHIKINEQQLAKYLNLNHKELGSQLTYLNQLNIISYTPQKDVPQITYLTENLRPGDLDIDMKLFQFRKERQKERIKDAIDYAEKETCRNVLLLKYFGEQGKVCGNCDVCTGRNKTQPADDEFETLKQKVRWVLEKEALSIEDLTASFSPKYREKVLTVISFLLDESIILKENEKLIWNM